MFSFYSMQHAQPQAMIVTWMVYGLPPGEFWGFRSPASERNKAPPCPSFRRREEARYLKRYVMRPRDRSYTDSSTVTLSPGRILM